MIQRLGSALQTGVVEGKGASRESWWSPGFEAMSLRAYFCVVVAVAMFGKRDRCSEGPTCRILTKTARHMVSLYTRRHSELQRYCSGRKIYQHNSSGVLNLFLPSSYSLYYRGLNNYPYYCGGSLF